MGHSTNYSIKIGFRFSYEEAFGSFRTIVPEVGRGLPVIHTPRIK